jgi:glutamyl-tRNA synthetase
VLILRNEDLDPQRCRSEFTSAMYEDLKWLGIKWQEGPDCGGRFGPYSQSERRPFYFEAWKKLREEGWIYPCSCSRKDLAAAAAAPNEGDDEPLYPGTCRERPDAGRFALTVGVNWRFRVPNGQAIEFVDGNLGSQAFVAGRDFGDFVVWRRDDVPAYQLAVTVDDAHMLITEVVRGADLLKSTARQLLVLWALGYNAPDYYHCSLVRDTAGLRMAKRHDSASMRHLRGKGLTPAQLLQEADALAGDQVDFKNR